MAVQRFTVGEVEHQARLVLLDTHEDAYRFEPDGIYAAMKDGLIRLRQDCPSSRYVAGLMVDLTFDVRNSETGVVTASFDDIPNQEYAAQNNFQVKNLVVNMERTWMTALVYYIVHRMYMRDDADTANAALADRYLQLFKEAQR